MRKFWIIIVILALSIILLSYFTESISVVRENNWSADYYNISSGIDYVIKYSYGEFSENYIVQKVVFQDAASLDDALARWIDRLSNLTQSRADIEIGGLTGELLGIINADTGKLEYHIEIKNGNILINGDGDDKEILVKVFEWFIERY